MPLTTFRQICLPYCLKRQANGRWQILNRERMPLGFAEQTSHEALKNLPVEYDFKGIGPKGLAAIAHSSFDDGNEIYLYDDGCLPDSSRENWEKYQARLWALTKFEKRH